MSEACGCGNDEPRGDDDHDGEPEKLWQIKELQFAALSGVFLLATLITGVLDAAEPVVAAPGEERITLRIRFAADAGPFNMPLTVRATHGEGVKRIVAESPLEIISP